VTVTDPREKNSAADREPNHPGRPSKPTAPRRHAPLSLDPLPVLPRSSSRNPLWPLI